MNIDEILTPEMDGLEINVPDTRVNAIMALNAVIGKGKDLERRLTIAREALERFEGCIDGYEYINSAEKALTQTAPKQSL